jgi:hypothetical protein
MDIAVARTEPRDFASPRAAPDPMNVVRAAAVLLQARATRVPVEQVLRTRYKDHQTVELITRAVQGPAVTSVPSWAGGLVRETFGAFLDTMATEGVAAQLGFTRYSFDKSGAIVIPTRASRYPTAPHLAASFRAQGGPIRIGATTVAATKLEPRSMGVVSTYTNSMLSSSAGTIEQLVHDTMLSDTAAALDVALLGDHPGDAVQPKGLGAYGTSVPSTGADAAAIAADLSAMYSRMTAAGYGTRPAWVMHPDNALALEFATTAGGGTAFAGAANGTLARAPIFTTLSQPLDVVLLIDQAAVAFGGGVPRFTVTEDATLHIEGDEGLVRPIAGPGATEIAGAVHSLFQEDTVALRAVWVLDWSVASDAAVQKLTAVAWGSAAPLTAGRSRSKGDRP